MTLNVLVAEDDKMWQGLHKMIFRERGIDAVIVGDLESALKVAKDEKFDLYVTDGSYPAHPGDFEENGMCYNFYQKIKEINPEAKIVLVSGMEYGFDSPTMKEKYPDMTYVSKGVFYQKIDELLKTIEVGK